MRAILIISFALIHSFAHSQTAEKLLQQGNEAYKKGDMKAAASLYSKAVQKDPTSSIAKYNLANALQQQHDYADAGKVYNDLLAANTDRTLRTKTLYNGGVSAVRQQQLEQAVEKFKGSLRLDPNDVEARENLQKALNELKKKKQEENKQDDKKQQDQQKKDDKKKPEPQKNKLDPNKAEQLLKQLQQQEKQLQKQVQKQRPPSQRQEKDW